MLACTKQELSTIQALVGYGASLTATNKDGWTPFHLACREGSTDIVSFLLTTDTGCWSSCSKNGRTPLHSAGERRFLRIYLGKTLGLIVCQTRYTVLV